MRHGPETLADIARVRDVAVRGAEERADPHAVPGVSDRAVGGFAGGAVVDAGDDAVV